MKRIIIFFYFVYFGVIAKPEEEILKNCFVIATPELVKDFATFIALRENIYGYKESEKVVIIDSDYFQKKKVNLLKKGDRIIGIDSCSMVDEFSLQNTIINNKYVSKNYLSKLDLLFAASTIYDIKGKIHKIYLIRDGKRLIIDVDGLE